jgi:hypothetical protein
MNDSHSSPRKTGLLTHRRFYLLVAPVAVLLLTVAPAVGQTVTGTISANPWTGVIIPVGQTSGTTTVTFSAPGADFAWPLRVSSHSASRSLGGQPLPHQR